MLTKAVLTSAIVAVILVAVLNRTTAGSNLLNGGT